MTRKVLIGAVAAVVVASGVFAAGGAGILFQAMFRALGTGAVDRAAMLKLRDVVSVKDFGATGDGTTDDTAAIQAAINSFGAAPACGSILIPRGTYKITTMLDVNNREACKLVGDGHGQATTSCAATLKWAGASGGTVLRVFSTRWSTFQDFCVDGNSLAGIGIDDTGLNATAANQQNHFVRLMVRGIGASPNRAIHIGSSTNDQVSESSFEQIACFGGPTCYYQDGSQTMNIRYLGGLVSGATTIGIDIAGGEAEVQHVDFENAVGSTDVQVEGSASVGKVTFVDNYHEDLGNSAAIAYNFPTGARVESTTFIGGRVLYTSTTGTVLSYLQQGPVAMVGTTFTSNSGGQGGSITFNGPGASPNVVSLHGVSIYNNNTLSCSGLSTCTWDGGGSLGGATASTQFRNQSPSVWGGSFVACDSTGANCYRIQSNSTQMRFIDTGGSNIMGGFAMPSATVTGIWSAQQFRSGGVTFGNLGTPANGNFTFCSDCTIANPCAGAGTGAIAKRLNGVWVCN